MSDEKKPCEITWARPKGRRGIAASNAQQTHCRRGHEFTPENTRIQKRVGGGSQRVCRECERRSQRRRKQRSKGMFS